MRAIITIICLAATLLLSGCVIKAPQEPMRPPVVPMPTAPTL